MSRRRRALVAVASSLAALGLAAGGGPASASASASAAGPDVAAVGWWTRSPGQQAPAGGFAVAAAPDGPVTVAAVRLAVGDGVTTAELRAVETGGVGQEAAGLQVCPTADSWEPVAGGSLEEAPAAACDSASAPFERDAAAGTWRADLTSLVAGITGEVSLVIVPGPVPAGGLPATIAYDVRVAEPTLDAEPVPSAGSAGEGGGGYESASPAGAESPSDAAPATSAGGGVSSGSFDAPSWSPGGFESAPQVAAPVTGDLSLAGGEPVPSATPDGAAAAGASGEAAQAGTGARRLTPVRAAGTGTPWGKGVAYVVASAVVAVLATGGRRLVRARVATA